jgi:hypothetical protein
VIKSQNWHVIALKLKPEYDPRLERLPPAVEFCCKKDKVYYPIFIGLDYNFLEDAKVYKQLLYRFIERAIQLNCNKVNFGVTASLEKRKLGAIAKQQVAYVQLKDTFNISVLNLVTKVLTMFRPSNRHLGLADGSATTNPMVDFQHFADYPSKHEQYFHKDTFPKIICCHSMFKSSPSLSNQQLPQMIS